MATNTPKLNLLRVQETWQFGDEAFNRFIDDADNKLVGVDHLVSPEHWPMWKPNASYVQDDIVRVSGIKSHQYYKCLVGGVSGAVSPTNDVTGSFVSDGTVSWEVASLTEASVNGGTILIWLSGNYYNRGDAVYYGNALYRCKVPHFASDWNADYIYWQEVFASIRFWKPTIYYFVDDTVIYEDLIFKCITAHKSEPSFSALEESNWEMIGGVGGAKDWESGEKYQEGQFVTVSGILYKSKLKHTSGSTFQGDISNWDRVNANIVEWEKDSYYPQGSLVQYGNVIYKSNTDHNSGSTNFEDDRVNWDMFHIPSAFVYNWSSNTYYYAGQFVLYNDSLYVCNTSHTSDTTYFANDDTKWSIVYTSLLQWAANKYYKVGSMVVYDGNIYRCKVANTDASFTASNWDKLTNIKINNWTANRAYEQNEIVLRQGILYRATSNHTSGSDFLTDSNKWEIIYSSIPLWVSGTDYKVGAVVLKDNILYRCTTDNNDSTFTDANWARLTAVFVNDWDTSTTYEQNELVLNQNILYRANTSHTSDATSFIADTSKWDMIYSSIPVWQSGKDYIVGALVIRNDSLFRCITANNDATFDSAKWDRLPFNHIKNWSSNTEYENLEVVLYDGVLYRANIDHTSGASFNTDSTKWDMVYANIREHKNEVFYKLGSIVINDGKLYKCKVEHTSSRFGFNHVSIYEDPSTFIHLGQSPDNVGSYTLDLGEKKIVYNVVFYQSAQMSYVKSATCFGSLDGINYFYMGNTTSVVDGEIVVNVYASVRYIRIDVVGEIITGLNLYDLIIIGEGDNWELLSGRESVLYDWKLSKEYYVDDVVIYNDKLYRCNENHISNISFENDKDYWDAFLYDSILDWLVSTEYKEGQYVRYGDKLYKCKTSHTSDTTEFFNDEDKWEFLYPVDDWKNSTYYPYHSIVIYEGALYRCKEGHISTFNFEDNYWEQISGSGGGGGGSGTGYSQIELKNVTATTANPYIVDLNIEKNLSHVLPPADVLKYISGEYGVSTMLDFISSDANKFSYNNNYVTFDGEMKLNQNVEVALQDSEPLGDNFVIISEDIDLSDFKSVDDLVVI